MRDYELMLMAIDEVISHDIAGIICMENYKNCYFPNGFRKAFELFCEFWKDYEANKEQLEGAQSQDMSVVKYRAKCCKKREDILKNYVEELKEIDSSIDYEIELQRYMKLLEEQDVQTQEMYLSVYPLLISLIREKEEKVEAV